MSDALTMAAPDPEDRWPDRTITNGQRTLGYVFINDDGSASAAGPAFEPLGVFPKLDAARAAVLANAGGGSNG